MRFLIVLYFTCFCHAICFAERNYILAENNSFTPRYNQFVAQMQLERERFTITLNGKTFTLSGYVGHGKTSMILKLDGENSVLRIPLKKELSQFINYTVEGAVPLKESGLSIVEIYEFERDFFVIAKMELIEFTLDEFLIISEHFSEKNFNKVMDQLVKEFIIPQAMIFNKIADFHAKQIAYAEGKWVLLDWSSPHIKWSETPLDINENFVLEKIENYAEKIPRLKKYLEEKRVREILYQKRKEHIIRKFPLSLPAIIYRCQSFFSKMF